MCAGEKAEKEKEKRKKDRKEGRKEEMKEDKEEESEERRLEEKNERKLQISTKCSKNSPNILHKISGFQFYSTLLPAKKTSMHECELLGTV